MSHSQFERRMFFVLGAIALIYAALAGLATVGDPDFGWQLARGRWMVLHHHIFSTDVLSYTVPGAPAVYPAFGGIFLYLVFVLGGYKLLSWLCAAVCAGTVALLLRRGNAVTAAIAILTVPFLAMRMVPRSELIAIPLFAAYVSLLWENYQTGRARLWLLPVLMVVWVNAHFSFFAGFGLLAAFGGVEVLEMFSPGERRTQAFERLKRDIPYFLATVAATLVNPWGWKIYEETAHYTEVALAIYVNEWAPVHWNWSESLTLRNTNNLGHLLLLIVVIALIVAVLQRRLGPFVLLLAAMYEVTQHLRLMALASCLLVVVGGSVLYSALPWISERMSDPRLRTALATAAVVIFAGIAVVRAADVVSNYHYLAERNLSIFGTGLSPWFPSEASEFIQKQNLPDQVYNTFDEGGYTLWQLGPERRDYVDGRESPFGAALIQHANELNQTPLDSELWRHEADKYGINTIIFPLVLDEFPLARVRSDCASKEWAPVYLDEVSIVLLRRTPQNADLIQRFQVDCAIAPLPHDPLPMTRASFPRLLNASRVLSALGRNTEALAVANKAMAIFPENAHAYWYRGQILDILQRQSDAEDDWKKALALAPREITPWSWLQQFQATVWSSLADLYSHQERIPEAMHAYEEVVRLTPDQTAKGEALVNLGALNHTIGKDSEAEKNWVAALAIAPKDGTVWLSLGELYLGTGRVPQAIHALEKGTQLTSDPTVKAHALLKLAQLYYWVHDPQKALDALNQAAQSAPPDLLAENSGRSFSFDIAQGRSAVWMALGNLQQATSFEEQAVKLNPDAADAWSHLAKLYQREGRLPDQQRAEQQVKKLNVTP